MLDLGYLTARVFGLIGIETFSSSLMTDVGGFMARRWKSVRLLLLPQKLSMKLVLGTIKTGTWERFPPFFMLGIMCNFRKIKQQHNLTICIEPETLCPGLIWIELVNKWSSSFVNTVLIQKTDYRHFSHATKRNIFRNLNLRRKANRKFCGNLRENYFKHLKLY